MGKLMKLGMVYHIYDHAVEKNNIFEVAANYTYFLDRYQTHLTPVVDTLAFCLMPNHFHTAIRVKQPEFILKAATQLLESWQLSKSSTTEDFQRRVSKQYSNFFSSIHRLSTNNNLDNVKTNKYRNTAISSSRFYHSHKKPKFAPPINSSLIIH